MRGSYFWLRTTWLYTRCINCINEKVDHHISSKFDEPFGVRFHFFENFLGTDVGWCDNRTFGWGWLDSLHDGYNRTNEKIGSRITKNWRAFRRSVPFWKIFWKPMSVDVRVVLLVGYDKTMYTCINEKIDSHIIEIRRAFRRSVSFFESFLGTDVGWCEGRTFGWVRQDYVHVYQRKDRLSHYWNSTSLSAFDSIFWKFFGNRCRLMWGSYFWLGTTRLYTSHVEFGTLWVWVVCNGYGQRGYPIPLSNNDMQTKV
jgi:hypothetical protein